MAKKTKLGRPPNPNRVVRSAGIVIRLTPLEKSTIKRAVGNGSVEDWCRQTVLTKAVVTRLDEIESLIGSK